MAHSLGGCLLMRFCNENNDIAKKFKKLIFLMPLITNDNYLVSTASKTRIFKDNKLFKPLVVPNNNLFAKTQISLPCGWWLKSRDMELIAQTFLAELDNLDD